MSALELRLVTGVCSMFSRRLSPQHSGSAAAAAADSHGCTAAIPPDEGGRWIEVHFWPRRRQTLGAPLGGDVERLQAVSDTCGRWQQVYYHSFLFVSVKLSSNKSWRQVKCYNFHFNISIIQRHEKLRGKKRENHLDSSKLQWPYFPVQNVFELFVPRNAYLITDPQKEKMKNQMTPIFHSLYETWRCHLQTELAVRNSGGYLRQQEHFGVNRKTHM